VRLDFRALPFRADCADGVFCAFTSWGYFATESENLRQLAEFARVLRPNGTLLLDLAGRTSLQAAMQGVEGEWLEFPEEGYEERAQWSPDGRRILTERVCQGEAFCHDIWIPTDSEIRLCLEQAGLMVTQSYGGLDGCSWEEGADRWIYRAVKQ
jgi:SAM-dependent methyltransferase